MRFVYFRADGCAVCHEKAPVVREVAGEREIPLEVVDFDSAAGREGAERLRIRTVPTLALVDGGRVRFRVIGRMITPGNVSFLLDRL